jgi:hypothetical protein
MSRLDTGTDRREAYHTLAGLQSAGWRSERLGAVENRPFARVDAAAVVHLALLQ